MAKKNTDVIRSDPELRKLINLVLAKNLARNKMVKTPRVTRAIANQYKNNPLLLKQLMEADL